MDAPVQGGTCDGGARGAVRHRAVTAEGHAVSRRQNPKMRKPELLAMVMRELGAKPEECVMVGDKTSDFEAAKKNGMESVAVAWGYGVPDELAEADRLARDAKEV